MTVRGNQENIIPVAQDSIIRDTVPQIDGLNVVLIDSIRQTEIREDSSSLSIGITPSVSEGTAISRDYIHVNTREATPSENMMSREITGDMSEGVSAREDYLKIDFEPFAFYERPTGKFSYKPMKGWHGSAYDVAKEEAVFVPKEVIRNQYNWTLAIGLLCILLLLYLRNSFQNFIPKVMNTLLNFQLSDTMLREKNNVVKRAFFLMNINYILVLSLFILLLIRLFEVNKYNNTFLDYIFILGIVIMVLSGRYMIYQLTAYIFDWGEAVGSQVHTNYLINKNLGLFLLPLVYISIYTTPLFSKIMLFTGIGIIILATLFRLIRSFQIIIKNGVLLFYAILYLCTLELLPIVLGSKLFILLR